ncbi:hypothetical protein ACU4GD_34000 [Cupriavidus basilensis]
MFNHDDRVFALELLQERNEPLAFVWTHAGHWLIKEHYLWLHRQRDCDLELTALTVIGLVVTVLARASKPAIASAMVGV